MKKILFGFIAIGLLTFVECGTSRRNISTIKDVDGNTYKTVKIGTQEWMAENLNVDHFRNGDVIPEVKTKEEWMQAGEKGQPVWCYYDNNPSNGEKYGKLYNWYTVNDSRALAPEGWHVPTDGEWTLLTDYLSANGHGETRGDALKSKSGWKDKRDGTSGNGTDDYGWSGLPGGNRGNNGDFSYIGGFGIWWSSSESSTFDAWYRYLGGRSCPLDSYSLYKYYGFSVRCLRD